jgi:GTP-binding protein
MAEDFFDQATIFVQSGNGGDGSAHFRRESHVPRGGPDGGNGGRGGHVYIVADPHLNTLLPFRYQSKFRSENGHNGQKQRQTGRSGRDVEVRVPPGTVVSAEIDGEHYSVDLERPGQRLLAAQGGRGGLGNVNFVSSTHQVPRIAELGEPGEELTIHLELKLLADVGLVGFPNAGKSTLLSVVSAAKPKIAPYPFTTLQPNLGVVEVGDRTFVMADIPGLIEGASQGVGLGFDFLRHVERTRVLIHVVDAAGTEGRNPLDDFRTINAELEAYQPELARRPQLVALNKCDLPDAQANLKRLRRELGVPAESIFAISAATGEGVQPLLERTIALVRELSPTVRRPDPDEEQELNWPLPEVNENAYTIEREEDGWRVRGRRIERLIAMTNFTQDESVDRIQRVLAATGISAALENAGVQEGDTVRIEKAELVWGEDTGR